MAQNVNNYNGATENNANGNSFGELTNSLIYPGQFQFQPNTQQGWPMTPSWPMNGQDAYSIGNSFQDQLATSNGYFPNQQDFVAFDEGDDFYNEDSDTVMGQEGQTPAQINGQSQSSHSGSSEARTEIPPTLQSTLAANQTAHQQNKENSQTSNPATKEDPAEKLALLRAKLIASKKPIGNTPTPEPKANNLAGNRDPKKMGVVALTSNTPNALSAWGNGSTSVATNNKKDDDKSAVKPNLSSSQPSHTSTDIDALLAEARETTNTSKNVPASHKPSSNVTTTVPLFGRETATIPKAASPMSAKHPLPTKPISRQHSLNESTSSSETSEQGEIREEPKKTIDPRVKSSPRPPVEPVPAEGPKPTLKTRTEVKNDQKIDTSLEQKSLQHGGNTKKQQPDKIDTAVANGRKGGPGISSAKPKSPPFVRTPSTSKAQDTRDPLPTLDYRDRDDRYSRRDRPLGSSWSGVDRRYDSDHERARDRYTREPRQADTFRPPYPSRKDYIDENERKAAEYKRSLQTQEREQPKEQEKEQKTSDIVMRDSSPEQNKANPNQQAVEYFEDVDEWLEMTGFHDKVYRNKALARHRKLAELDRQRAELEREAQAELEERSQLARARSTMPRESVEGPSLRSSLVTPKGFPVVSMLPPPIPAKESQQDVGIQIKDLATREQANTPRRVDANQLLESPTTLTPAVKRQFSGDELDGRAGRQMDKLARTDSKDFSSDKKQQRSPIATKPSSGSLESRISVNDGLYRHEHPRERSSEPRPRSLSEDARRASGYGQARERENSRGSISPAYPPYSRGASPDYLGPAYDNGYDRSANYYRNYRSGEYDNRSTPGYDNYNPNQRGAPHQQNSSNNHRGRGRGRGRARGGHVNSRGNAYYKSHDDE